MPARCGAVPSSRARAKMRRPAGWRCEEARAPSWPQGARQPGGRSADERTAVLWQRRCAEPRARSPRSLPGRTPSRWAEPPARRGEASLRPLQSALDRSSDARRRFLTAEASLGNRSNPNGFAAKMIRVQGLTKYYGHHAAIRDLAFQIERGEVIGFLGLNGAGKTTTLKILGCVLLPTSGRVTIDELDVVGNPHEVRKRIGFLPDAPPLYEEMTVGAYLSFVAQLRGVSAQAAPSRVQTAEEQMALREVHREIISSLSHGFRQRLGVAQALVHNPALVILDEPNSGLDPAQIVEMRALIKNLRGAHTILISSHILSEISQTCDRLLIIQEGEIVAQGTESELAQRLGGSGFIEVDVRPPAQRALDALRALTAVESVALEREQDGIATLRVRAPAEMRPNITRALVAANVDIYRIDRVEEKLESIFLKLTRKEAA